MTDLRFSVIVHFSASTDALSPQTTATQLWRSTILYKRTTHLWEQGCGDRECLLLDLRSALCGIPASSGFAHHFESRFRPQRLTSVGRFFLCVCVRARVLTDLWFSVISLSVQAQMRHHPKPLLHSSVAQLYCISALLTLGGRVAGIV